jgi:hypothetical protein
MNFLVETKNAISESGHKISDIIFIGSEDTGHQCSWEQFKNMADVEYYSGFGAAEVATDLVLVFSDGMKMWRGEYDGSEWWEFSTPFTMPTDKQKIKKLVGGMWATVKAMQAIK